MLLLNLDKSFEKENLEGSLSYILECFKNDQFFYSYASKYLDLIKRILTSLINNIYQIHIKYLGIMDNLESREEEGITSLNSVLN